MDSIDNIITTIANGTAPITSVISLLEQNSSNALTIVKIFKAINSRKDQKQLKEMISKNLSSNAIDSIIKNQSQKNKLTFVSFFTQHSPKTIQNLIDRLKSKTDEIFRAALVSIDEKFKINENDGRSITLRNYDYNSFINAINRSLESSSSLTSAEGLWTVVENNLKDLDKDKVINAFIKHCNDVKSEININLFNKLAFLYDFKDVLYKLFEEAPGTKRLFYESISEYSLFPNSIVSKVFVDHILEYPTSIIDNFMITPYAAVYFAREGFDKVTDLLKTLSSDEIKGRLEALSYLGNDNLLFELLKQCDPILTKEEVFDIGGNFAQRLLYNPSLAASSAMDKHPGIADIINSADQPITQRSVPHEDIPEHKFIIPEFEPAEETEEFSEIENIEDIGPITQRSKVSEFLSQLNKITSYNEMVKSILKFSKSLDDSGDIEKSLALLAIIED